jgi:ribosomal protein L6P/L9E
VTEKNRYIVIKGSNKEEVIVPVSADIRKFGPLSYKGKGIRILRKSSSKAGKTATQRRIKEGY